MTIVAWDGRTLASDTMGVTGDSTKIYNQEKIIIFDGETIAVGGAGDPCVWNDMAFWYTNGVRDPSGFPEDPTGNSAVLIIDMDQQRVYIYAGKARPYLDAPLNTKVAIGSGREIAIGAMEHGATAVEAVGYAIKRSFACGGFINHTELNDDGRFEMCTLTTPPTIEPDEF
jgi:hypothetical protein